MRKIEIAKRGNYLELPPVGVYLAEIRDVRIVEADKNRGQQNDTLEMMVEITDGEYKGRYMEVYNDQKERFGDEVKYKGVFRLFIPGDEPVDWIDRKFSNNIWCVQESNGDYEYDSEDANRFKKLKGKKIGINIRKYLYTYNGQSRETTEIGQFETVDDVKAGKCREMKPRDRRENKDSDSTDGQNFTDVSSEVSVPW